MSYYNKIKKLDLESAEKMQEGTGPSDKCICSLLAAPEDKRSIAGIFTTKQAVQRSSACGKCGCDSNKFVMKHSDMKIKIISPDVSSICPCPNDCLPNKANLANNIKVTVEHVKIDPDTTDSEYSLNNFPKNGQDEQIDEPDLCKLSMTDLINAQFDIEEIDEKDFNDNDDDDVSQWSFGDHLNKSDDDEHYDQSKLNGKKVIDEFINTNDDKYDHGLQKSNDNSDRSLDDSKKSNDSNENHDGNTNNEKK